MRHYVAHRVRGGRRDEHVGAPHCRGQIALPGDSGSERGIGKELVIHMLPVHALDHLGLARPQGHTSELALAREQVRERGAPSAATDHRDACQAAFRVCFVTPSPLCGSGTGSPSRP